MKVKELKRRLKEWYKDDDEICAHLWEIQDVFDRIEFTERDLKLTKEDAENIIDNMNENIDSDQGVNWYTIDYWLDEYERLSMSQKAQNVPKGTKI